MDVVELLSGRDGSDPQCGNRQITDRRANTVDFGIVLFELEETKLKRGTLCSQVLKFSSSTKKEILLEYSS
jgi:hypothetical protein